MGREGERRARARKREDKGEWERIYYEPDEKWERKISASERREGRREKIKKECISHSKYLTLDNIVFILKDGDKSIQELKKIYNEISGRKGRFPKKTLEKYEIMGIIKIKGNKVSLTNSGIIAALDGFYENKVESEKK